ncbi:hypothetical protein Mapa_005682 [Marchantia paleacea]|nr:hypothetical protein Mapa_005682 [Marchantia paleacea]
MRLQRLNQTSSTCALSSVGSSFTMKLSYQIQVPLQTMVPTILSVSSPKKATKPRGRFSIRSGTTISWIILLTLFGILSMIKVVLVWHPADLSNDNSFTILPTTRLETYSSVIEEVVKPFGTSRLGSNLTLSSKLFWRESDGVNFQPCIEFSSIYTTMSPSITSTKSKYLIVVVNGGLNQQRNQIVDAVIIARILGAALVVPILQVNQIWEDKSEFSDIFDVAHFKRTLKDDVLIVTNLPSTLIMSKPIEIRNTPFDSNPEWFRSHYATKFHKGSVLLLRSLDSRLSKDLPSDLQRLRCKVAFHALRFSAPIQALGERLAERIAKHGPYVALHLRLEKDVWVRTGCSSGLGPSFEEEIEKERIQKPQFLTTRNNMTYTERRKAGQCPLNAEEVGRLLTALGATERTIIFWAGGEPLGGARALQPLTNKFPLLYNKDDIALPEELKEFKTKKSMLAAIDYVVCLKSDLFIPSHGGNMGRAVKGSRIYAGWGRNITPNKRLMLRVLDNTTLSKEEADQSIAELHTDPTHQFEESTGKKLVDVLSNPIPDCMCQVNSTKE